MGTPIIIPMNMEPPKCPYCGRILPQSDISTRDVLIGILLLCLAIGFVGWLIITVLEWTSPGHNWKHAPTLVEILQYEWQCLVDLSHRIY